MVFVAAILPTRYVRINGGSGKRRRSEEEGGVGLEENIPY